MRSCDLNSIREHSVAKIHRLMIHICSLQIGVIRPLCANNEPKHQYVSVALGLYIANKSILIC
jgi:hypothetical protein